MIRFCYFHFISVLLSLPNGSVFLTNNGSRRRGKVRGFLRRGHIIPFRPRSCPRFRCGGVSSSVFVLRSPFLSERTFRHTSPHGIVAKSTPDLSLSEGFIQLSMNRREKDPLNTIGKKNGIFTNKFQKKFGIYIWFIIVG